tara:strand:- start:411 stop:1358 length:948 start_codon:yes stop_codon:yes gene_type:complete
MKWKCIKDSNNKYYINSKGQVRGPSGKILKPTLLKIGYYSIAFSMGNYKVVRKYIHKLVAETFLGDIPKNKVVNHINGNKLDNRLSNLEIVSRLKNASHWSKKNRNPNAGRIFKEYCDRGHKLHITKKHRYCTECRKNRALGVKYYPPEDTKWIEYNHSNYLISKDGRVWSNKRQKLLKPGINKPGYKYVVLMINGQGKVHAIHRLVASVYIREMVEKEIVDHINGDKLNNNVENLRILSTKKNLEEHRKRVRGTKTQGFKLTEKDVAEIKWLLKNTDLNQNDISKRYGVVQSHVSQIHLGLKWKHIMPKEPKED